MTAVDVVHAEHPAGRPDAILAAVGAAAHRFLTLGSPWEESALEVLAGLGVAAGASRSYVFENYRGPDGDLRTTQRFQWTSSAAPSQDHIPEAVDFAYDDLGLARWAQLLGAGEPVHGVTSALPAVEQRELVIEGILAIALVPIMVEGRWWGFVGFDECAVERPWSPRELDALRAAAGMLGAVIARERTAGRLREQQRLLRQRVSALARIAGELITGASLEAKLRILAEGVVEASDAVGCSVALVRPDPLELVGVEAHGLPEGYAAAYRRVWDAGTTQETQQALQIREPVVIPHLAPDLARDPRNGPLAEALGDLIRGAVVIVPLIAGGTPLGVVHAYYAAAGPVHDDALVFLRAIADQGALAVEHARLLDEAARTTLLEERQRLSRELHDSVSQAVYGIALGARTARSLLDTDPSRVAEPLDYVLTLAEAGLAEMRALIFELRPESLQREGLVAALGKQIEALRARHQIHVASDLCEEPDQPLERKEAVYRIGQEALHNIVKHARATRVEVRLTDADGTVVLEVVDDGVGFDAGADFPGHLGLHTMRERAQGCGARLTISSRPGQGSRLRLVLPRT